jgi:intracellular septation protein
LGLRTLKFMQALLEFAPLLAFIIAYYLGGLYTATAVLMAAMVVLLIVDYVLQRRIPPMHGLSAVLVFVLGAATLLFHDKHFIQVKPTALFWLAGIAFLGSFWIGERTLAERMGGPALDDKLKVSAAQWRQLNGASVLFYALLGAANLAVAYFASERAWVYFKMFGLAVLTFIFVALQVAWLSNRAQPVAAGGMATPDAPR